MQAHNSDDHNWLNLTQTAQKEVDSVLAALPDEVRERLLELPITFDPKPNADMVAGGIDPDRTLGIFTGVPYSRAIAVSQHLPPQIILFLENIYGCVSGDLTEFRLQVRRTLLHEIGHYLGLNEDEVDVRGL
jgi:predicted Zn-dependent protease with MMP-like domain